MTPRTFSPVFAASVAIALLLGGCAMQRHTYGRPVPASQLELIEPGRVTRNEVLAILGAPDGTQRHVGGSVYSYRFRFQRSDETKVSFFNASATYSEETRGERRVEVYFDRRGIVRDVAAVSME